MAEDSKVVLIPRMPTDLALDLLFMTAKGLAVQASPEEIQTLQSQGVPVLELYSSSDDYASALFALTEQEATAAIETLQNTALAALTPEEQNQFPVA
jgi:hypothetical protein